VAHTVLEVIERDDLLARASVLGDRIAEGLRSQLANCPAVREVRGRGLMIGVVLDRPCGDLVRLALDAGLLINVTADSVIRLLPPMILSNEQADQIVAEVARLVEEFVTA